MMTFCDRLCSGTYKEIWQMDVKCRSLSLIGWENESLSEYMLYFIIRAVTIRCVNKGSDSECSFKI